MRKSFWKELRMRALTGIVAGTLMAGSIAGPVQMVRAADTDTQEQAMDETTDEESPVITDESFWEIMNEYKESSATDQSPIGPEDIAINVLKHLVKKSGEKLEDKAFDKVFEVIFGGNQEGAEMLEKMGVLEKKIDQISEMLNQIGVYLKKQELKDSIKLKQEDIRSIKAAADQASADYEAASKSGKTPQEVKAIRWKVLQTWYEKFSLHGTGNAMTSMRHFCYRLTNEGNLNEDLGNYITQYEKYGKYSFDWDVDRVAFTMAQKNRDMYYLAQMASLNLLYFDYAKDHPQAETDGASKEQVAELLNKVIQTYDKTTVVKLYEDRAHYEKVIKPDMQGDNDEVEAFTIYKKQGELSKGFIQNEIYNVVREDNQVQWVIDHFRSEANKSRIDGYHLMTNGERDALVKASAQRKMTLYDFMDNGGMEMKKNSHNSEVMATSLNRGDSTCWSYGGMNYSSRERSIYFENYNMTEMNAYRNTRVGYSVMKVRDHDAFADWPIPDKGKNTPCINKFRDDSDYFMSNNFTLIWVKDDSTRVEDKGYEEEQGIPEDAYITAEGTIGEIVKNNDKICQVTLQTVEGQLKILCDESMIEEQDVKEGQQVSIKYSNDGEESYVSFITILDGGNEQITEETQQITEGPQQITEVTQQEEFIQ